MSESPEELEEELEEDWDDEEEDGFYIRAKWSIDGAKTLKEAAQKAREFVSYLESLDEEFELVDEVEDDYGFVRPKK